MGVRSESELRVKKWHEGSQSKFFSLPYDTNRIKRGKEGKTTENKENTSGAGPTDCGNTACKIASDQLQCGVTARPRKNEEKLIFRKKKTKKKKHTFSTTGSDRV